MPDTAAARSTPERGQHHWHAFVISAVMMALMTLAVQQSGGGWREARMAGLLTYNLLSVIAGLLVYVSWRLLPRPWLAWLVVVVLGISLAEMPFMLMGFVAEPAEAVPGGEAQEVLAVWLAVLGLRAGVAGRPLPFSPLIAGVSAGVALALVRAVGLRLGPDTLAPDTPLGVTQRLAILVGMVLLLRAVWQLFARDPRMRVTYLVIFFSTTSFALNDTGVDWLGPNWGVVVTVFYMVLLAQLQVEASLTMVVRALIRRQREMTSLAVRAATAREMVNRGEQLLDAVRSSVGPLARAASVLEGSTVLLSENRDVMARAMRREIERINRSLGNASSGSASSGDASSAPAPFLLDDVVGPLVQFQQAQGHQVDWTDPGLQVVHDPDTVARALGVAIGLVVGTTAPGALVVTAHAEPRPGALVGLRVLPASGRGETWQPDPSNQLVGLDEATVAGLRSVERLLRAHGGALNLLVSDSGGTGVEVLLRAAPAAPSA